MGCERGVKFIGIGTEPTEENELKPQTYYALRVVKDVAWLAWLAAYESTGEYGTAYEDFEEWWADKVKEFER